MFPAELRTLLESIDGENAESALIPMASLFSLDEILEQINMQATVDAGDPRVSGRSGVAVIPFAGLDGYNYCVRVGKNGYVDVVFVDKVDGVDADGTWASLDAFFAEVLLSLQTGSEFQYQRPTVTDGLLTWDMSD